MRKAIKNSFFLVAFFVSVNAFAGESLPIANKWKLPLAINSRKNLDAMCWKENAGFLAKRTGHLHTGIDLINPMGGQGEKVYAAAAGRVVSIYAKEPNRSIMIQHSLPCGETLWTVYVHVGKVKVRLGELVTSDTVIAYLMDEHQLNYYGWEFNHLHFEVLKFPRINEVGKYLSFSTGCKTRKEVKKHFYNPIDFLKKMWAAEKFPNQVK